MAEMSLTLSIVAPNGELTFTLSQAVPYKVINENLAVEISGEEMFRRTSAISIRLYYN